MFLFNLKMEVCFEYSGDCRYSYDILENTQLPKLPCDWLGGFAIPGMHWFYLKQSTWCDFPASHYCYCKFLCVRRANDELVNNEYVVYYGIENLIPLVCSCSSSSFTWVLVQKNKPVIFNTVHFFCFNSTVSYV